jgi:hypothetical protein
MYLRNILWFDRWPDAVRKMWVFHAKSRQSRRFAFPRKTGLGFRLSIHCCSVDGCDDSLESPRALKFCAGAALPGKRQSKIQGFLQLLATRLATFAVIDGKGGSATKGVAACH